MRNLLFLRTVRTKTDRRNSRKSWTHSARGAILLAFLVATAAYSPFSLAEDWKRLQDRQSSTIDFDVQSVAQMKPKWCFRSTARRKKLHYKMSPTTAKDKCNTMCDD